MGEAGVVESVEMMRLLRLEVVRGAGRSISFSRVLRREEGPREEEVVVVRMEVERLGSSVDEEFALEEVMSERRAPWREGGGGGGDLVLAAVVVALAISPGVGVTPGGGTSRDC